MQPSDFQKLEAIFSKNLFGSKLSQEKDKIVLSIVGRKGWMSFDIAKGTFTVKEDTIEIDHFNSFTVSGIKDFKKLGIGRCAVKSLVEYAEEKNIPKIIGSASGNGGYAWAKMAFLSKNEQELSGIKRQIEAKYAQTPPDNKIKNILKKLLMPKDLWIVADDKNGFKLLNDVTYAMVLDLSDPESMSRFNAYQLDSGRQNTLNKTLRQFCGKDNHISLS